MSEAGSSSNSQANRQNFNIEGRGEKRVFNKPMAYFCMNGEMADVEFVFYHQNKITVCLFRLLISVIAYFLLMLGFFRKFLLTHLRLEPQKYFGKNLHVAMKM